MQSPAATRRAFSLLASKIHPQLPLSPRESQQLLNLLTASFRAHLDREHPAPSSDSPRGQKLLPSPPKRLRNVSSDHHISSHGSTTEHIDSILTNPLFSSRPRRTSDTTIKDAREVLRDPLGWFKEQIALGTADVAKADLCLSMLGREATGPDGIHSQARRQQSPPGTQIAEWLWASGMDKSPEFFSNHKLVHRLVLLLIEENQVHRVWHWLESTPSTGSPGNEVDPKIITSFKRLLMKDVMSATIARIPSLDDALSVFLRAYKILTTSNQAEPGRILQSAGSTLLDYIIANPLLPASINLYEAFMKSSRVWGGVWSRGIDASLWLHHPSKPSAQPGLDYLKDPSGATRRIRTASTNRRQFLVQLYLGVARQLLAETKYTDAQFALQLSRDHFPELLPVHPDSQTVRRKEPALQKQRSESENLAMLDRLLPT